MQNKCSQPAFQWEAELAFPMSGGLCAHRYQYNVKGLRDRKQSQNSTLKIIYNEANMDSSSTIWTRCGVINHNLLEIFFLCHWRGNSLKQIMGLTMSQISINPSIMPLSMVTGTHDLINQAEKPKLTSVFWSQGILVKRERQSPYGTNHGHFWDTTAYADFKLQGFLQGPHLFALLIYANLTGQREVFRGT